MTRRKDTTALDSLERAVYETAHDHPGGVPDIARKINMRAGTLFNKCDPGMEHKLTLFEARAMMLATGDHRILKALADDLGYICIPAGGREGTSDVDLLTAYARVDKERGDVGRRLLDALEDGRVTREEVVQVRDEVREEIEALQELLARLEAVAE